MAYYRFDGLRVNRSRKYILFTLSFFSTLSFFVIIAGNFALAQVAASISGKIEDATGAAVPSATVTIMNLETGVARTVATDEAGNYRALSLPVGQYEVRAEKTGFMAAVRRGINLVVGQQAVVSLNLEVGTVQQEVTVMAEAPLVNTTTASVSGLVGERQVKDLPLNGRSFDNLITLNAGAVNYTSNTKTAAVGSGAGAYFSVAGRRPNENLFLLNGVEYTGTSEGTVTPGGVSGLLLGIDAVREFNVVSDSYSAAYGKRPGAQVSVVTQSGTNRLHGTAFEFLRNSKLDARNFFDYTPGLRLPPFKRNQFGGALSGPMRKDKSFVFGNYEGFRQRLGISAVAFVPDDNARRGLLPNAQGAPTPVAGLDTRMLPYMAFWPQPNGPTLGGGVALAFSNPKQTVREDFGTTRLDHNFSARDSLSGVYTIDDGDNLTPQPNPFFGGLTTLRSQVLSAQEEHIFSPQMINTFRAGLSRARSFFTTAPLAPFPARLSFVAGMVPGALSIGGGAGNVSSQASSISPAGGTSIDQVSGRNLFTYSDDIQLIKGKHQISLGAWFQRLQDNRAGAARAAGQANFTNLQSFLQGTVATFTGVPNRTPTGYRMLMGAWYVEDNITLKPNLTVRLGLRHEFTNGWNEVLGREPTWIVDPNGVLETNPAPGNVFTENNAKLLFSPRFGLAWDPFGKGKTSIRAGLGTYYHLQDALGFIIDGAPPFNSTITFGQSASFPPLVPVQPGVPSPPACGPGVPQPCSIYAPQGLQSSLKTPTVEEWNFTVEQQITPNTSLRAAYVGSRVFHEIVAVDPNAIHPQICSNAAGCQSGGISRATGSVPQGAEYIPVGTRPNPFLANGFFWYSEGNVSYHALQMELNQRFYKGLLLRANYTFSKNLDIGSGLTASMASNQAQMVMNPYNPRRDWGPSALNITNQASIRGSYELPLGNVGATRRVAPTKLLSGWQVNWILTLLSGFPSTPQVGSNQSGNGDSRNPDRPSVNPAFSGPVVLGTPNRWFNANAYLLPVSGTWGNLGRGTLMGPGLGELDLSLFKSTSLTESMKLQFRAEFFNVLNRANFGSPNPIIFAGGAVNPSAGVVTNTATTSRQIQFGLKLIF